MKHSTEVFFLLFDTTLFLTKSSIWCTLDKKTPHDFSQSNYHLIHLADIQREYLIYFQVFNMPKCLHDRCHLKHCIFHCRMLHLVFLHNDQYFISWNYLGYHLVVHWVLFQSNTETFSKVIFFNKAHSRKYSP